MKNSWISALLPSDEYKEKKMLYFLSEAGIVLFFCLLLSLFFHRISVLNLEIGLLLTIAASLLYLSIRYILSGIEYPDITTEKSYKRERSRIIRGAFSFLMITIILSTLFNGLPGDLKEWLELFAFFSLMGVFYFVLHFVSLKKSFRKNKELL